MAEGRRNINMSNQADRSLIPRSLTEGRRDVVPSDPACGTPRSLFLGDSTTGVYIKSAVNVQSGGTMTVYMDSSSYRKKITKAQKPLTQSEEPVTIDQMLDIKDRLGNDWKDLGRRLKFADAELDQMKQEHKDDMGELNYKILSRWMEREPQQATQTYLAKIFMKMSRGDLADLLVLEEES